MSDPAPPHCTYYLRPRNANPNDRTETETDEEDDHENDPDYVEGNNDLVITISQKTKKQRNKTNPCLINNQELPCIPFTVTNFEDLFRLATLCVETNSTFKDCQLLPTLYPVLQELNAMIGLTKAKDAICHMILFELQKPPEIIYYRNMVITGKPGAGKTEISKLIAKLFNRLMSRTDGCDEITVGKPLNMIAKFEGQTKNCVDNVVRRALSKSGVLVIDEAHTLNNPRHNHDDAYGQQALDQLMSSMDQYIGELIVIFLGYPGEIETNILQSNAGFRRRIQWFLHLEDYNAHEICQIFIQKMAQHNFQLQPDTRFTENWFTDHLDCFPSFGGSIETFVVKICHIQTMRTFGQHVSTVVSDDVIEQGFQLYSEYILQPAHRQVDALWVGRPAHPNYFLPLLHSLSRH